MHAGVCYWALIVKLGEESIRERVREEVGSWVVVGGCCCSALLLISSCAFYLLVIILMLSARKVYRAAILYANRA